MSPVGSLWLLVLCFTGGGGGASGRAGRCVGGRRTAYCALVNHSVVVHQGAVWWCCVVEGSVVECTDLCMGLRCTLVGYPAISHW